MELQNTFLEQYVNRCCNNGTIVLVCYDEFGSTCLISLAIFFSELFLADQACVIMCNVFCFIAAALYLWFLRIVTESFKHVGF